MITCPRCTTIVQTTSRFCEICGASLDGMTVPDDPPTRPAGERRKICRCVPQTADYDADEVCRQCGLLRPAPELFGLMLAIDADLAALSDRGRRSSRAGLINQDAVAAARLTGNRALLAVADGVSMSNRAEAASAAAVAALCAALAADDAADPAAMRRAILAAQAAVLAVPVVQPKPGKDPPETTVAAAVVRHGRATIG
jgi:RNA polymerase subunit RPABC4/transcription elongation factor Spt4